MKKSNVRKLHINHSDALARRVERLTLENLLKNVCGIHEFPTCFINIYTHTYAQYM